MDKVRIMEHVKGPAPMKATIITKQRSGLIIGFWGFDPLHQLSTDGDFKSSLDYL